MGGWDNATSSPKSLDWERNRGTCSQVFSEKTACNQLQIRYCKLGWSDSRHTAGMTINLSQDSKCGEKRQAKG